MSQIKIECGCAMVPAYDQYKDCPTCVAASDSYDHDWSVPCPLCNRVASTVLIFAPHVVGRPTDSLTDALLAAIHAANLARSAANAAEPYVHADYAAHEQRIYRLVDALADGDQVLADRFNDALFDITHDGLAWMRQTYTRLARDVTDEREGL
jgi:hypothetical protein